MGGICSNSSKQEIGGGAEDAGRSTDMRLQKSLDNDKKKDKSVKKLLLLGPGNSGKSTFFKQLASIHNEGYLEENKLEETKAIYDSILAQMKALIIECRALNYDSGCGKKTLDGMRYFDELPRDIEINEEIAAQLTVVWSDPKIKEAFKDRTNLSVVDSAPYFFDNIHRIAEAGYQPNTQDMLLVRTPTTGVVDCAFSYNTHDFRLYDVGGQRSERSKWIHCFDAVTAVLFVASLSCFDQQLFEDQSVNAMREALSLFEETCNSRWFRKTSMILFLNKSDLFFEKIKRKSLKICFEEYDGPDQNFDAAVEYVRQQFINQNDNPRSRQIYSHITCATDQENVKKVFNDVQHIIVSVQLQRGGLV